MKNILIANYSVYTDRSFYSPENSNFTKLYKGVRVTVENRKDCPDKNPKFVYFAIRTKKVKDTIWKLGREEMRRIVFDDNSCSIFCDRQKDPKNKSKDTLAFSPEVYSELKEKIPMFFKHQGWKGCFTVENKDGKMILEF